MGSACSTHPGLPRLSPGAWIVPFLHYQIRSSHPPSLSHCHAFCCQSCCMSQLLGTHTFELKRCDPGTCQRGTQCGGHHGPRSPLHTTPVSVMAARAAWLGTAVGLQAPVPRVPRSCGLCQPRRGRTLLPRESHSRSVLVWRRWRSCERFVKCLGHDVSLPEPPAPDKTSCDSKGHGQSRWAVPLIHGHSSVS